MLEIIAVLALISAVIVLVLLSMIDLAEGLLPNELVLGLLCLGVVFHLCTMFTHLSMVDMALGAFIGSASLYLIRFVANWFYKTDTLGLGDVKLMGAAGVWLGPYFILMALTAGAFAGIFHGLGFAGYLWVKTKHKPNFSMLSLPAGPGFAVGIVVAAAFMLKDFNLAPPEFLNF